MNGPQTEMAPTPIHPPGFRPRRGLNWGMLGLLYTSYYLCRYNFSIANPYIRAEYGFNKMDMSWILLLNSWAYAAGQVINGLLTDRIGGKIAMLIGAAGTIAANLMFGAGSWVGSLSLFTLIWIINGYMQAFGAPGMIKMNAAWFAHRERGTFAGIFGFMINLGRFGIFQIGAALMVGFTLFGMVTVAPQHWRWLFWAPAVVCSAVAIGMALTVKQTPEEAGFHHLASTSTTATDVGPGQVQLSPTGQPITVLPYESRQKAAETTVKLGEALKFVLSKPAVWFTASAYMCTGAVRGAIDEWFPSYMLEHRGVELKDPKFQILAIAIPLVASLGSLLSGVISDKFFKSARAPVAATLYAIETIVLILAAQFSSVAAAITFFILISFTANSTHSLLGTAAAMDIGGRKMSGFASGVIDAFQYIGKGIAIIAMGFFLHHYGWNIYFYCLAPFGLLGMVLMIFGTWFIEPHLKKPSHA